MKYEKKMLSLRKTYCSNFAFKRTRMYAKLKGVTLRGNFSKSNNITSYNIKLNLPAKTHLSSVLNKDLPDFNSYYYHESTEFKA